MKKVLVVAVVGGLLVGGIVLAKGPLKAATPEGKVCIRMSELCATDKEKTADNFDACVEHMEKVKKMSGPSSFERSQKCIDESQSCSAAVGCMAGGAGVGMMGELMKGFGTALSK